MPFEVISLQGLANLAEKSQVIFQDDYPGAVVLVLDHRTLGRLTTIQCGPDVFVIPMRAGAD